MFLTVAMRNLIDGGRKTLLSIAGICFAIILIFMQLGFLGAVLDTAVLFYNNLNFDLIACSPHYHNFADPKTFSRTYLKRIENCPEVERVMPYHVSLCRWSYAQERIQRGMLLMAADPNSNAFKSSDAKVRLPEITQLKSEHFILVDEKSNKEFLGQRQARRFSSRDIGLNVELNDQRVEIAGLFRLGTGLAANGAAMINELGFQRVYPGYGTDRVGLGLVKLTPATRTSPASARDRIYQQLGFVDPWQTKPPVEILTHAEIVSRERIHWIRDTPVGFIFLSGVVISFVVGLIIVYIVLSTDINRQLSEYATLKAMGYADRSLYRIVLEQAIWLGLISYAVSYAVCLVLYQLIGAAANLPITMTPERQFLVITSSLLMCCLSAIVAMRKLRSADPADLF